MKGVEDDVVTEVDEEGVGKEFWFPLNIRLPSLVQEELFWLFFIVAGGK